MYSKVNTAIISGIDSLLVCAETDISEGMPVFSMVGLLSNEVKEAKERVRTSLKNLGINLPVKRITVNISPASVKKSGTSFDLPIAISVLKAMNIISCCDETLNLCAFFGELGLNGNVLSVNGILPMVLSAKENHLKYCIVPKSNYNEANLIPGIKIIGISNVMEAIEFLNSGIIPKNTIKQSNFDYEKNGYTDFSQINGIPFLRRALEVAVSGFHNILMIGPPGAGKSFISKALPTIMPPLKEDEQIELSKIYSVSGLFGERSSLLSERPFRSPHHTITDIGLVGGGIKPSPGEISLAHKGILFLDEMLEFKRQTLEMLRQPLEEGNVHIVRASKECTFPADFMLVCATNPCPCGYYPDINKCSCTPTQIKKYRSKLSKPLIDRIDMCIEVPSIKYTDITSQNINESSKDIRKRVCLVHSLQDKRYKSHSFKYNARIPSKNIETFCKIDKDGKDYIKNIFDSLELTARSYYKLLKVSRTIADMENEDYIKVKHIKEACCYRMTMKEGI